ncbi:MAG TPA: ATP-binding protein [Kofleriaceae bacterium]|nr:ATP-binding protein [Kofleriaceae bacterium]
MKILLVEDNQADARLFSELLSELSGKPFTLTHADTLDAALRVVGEHDVVFLDLSLPDAHGLSTIKRMIAAARHVPIVVLTGTDDAKIAVEAMKTGAQDYLTKGDITPALIQRTARYAVERKLHEENARQLAMSDQAAVRASFLSSLMTAINGSLDLGATLPQVARLLVPTLGDFAVIDLVRDGKIERLAWASANPAHEAALRELASYVPGPASPRSPVLAAIESGTTAVLPELDYATLAPTMRYLELAKELQIRNAMVVPLISRGRVIGAMTGMLGASQRVYTDELRRLAEDAAERIAIGIDNASLYAEAQRAIRGRDELLAVVSHDLRNPLNIIALALQMMESDASTVSSALPRAKRGADRMLRLIEDLLDVARIDSGTLRVEPSRTDLVGLLDDQLEQHRVLAADRRITLVRDFERGLGHVLADRHRIGQALANLVGNALKFTPPGGTIRIGADVRGDRVAIWVADTGPGIPSEHLGHIFDRFWQPQQRRDGVGLGLAIVKGIVDAHGGAIEVESTVGIGTTFRFTLPRAEQRAVTPRTNDAYAAE